MESIQWVIDQLGRNAELTKRPISKGTRSEHSLLRRFKWCDKCKRQWEWSLEPRITGPLYPGGRRKYCHKIEECPQCRQ